MHVVKVANQGSLKICVVFVISVSVQFKTNRWFSYALILIQPVRPLPICVMWQNNPRTVETNPTCKYHTVANAPQPRSTHCASHLLVTNSRVCPAAAPVAERLPPARGAGSGSDPEAAGQTAGSPLALQAHCTHPPRGGGAICRVHQTLGRWQGSRLRLDGATVARRSQGFIMLLNRAVPGRETDRMYIGYFCNVGS